MPDDNHHIRLNIDPDDDKNGVYQKLIGMLMANQPVQKEDPVYELFGDVIDEYQMSDRTCEFCQGELTRVECSVTCNKCDAFGSVFVTDMKQRVPDVTS